jgi:GNAT superfamily N-acetyltransferase
MNYTRVNNDYVFSNDKSKLQVKLIHNFLSNESYWAKNIPVDTVEKAIEGSLCYGVYHHEQQIAFARVITDCATFAYLADVFVIKRYRGVGVSKQLMNFIMDDCQLKNLRRFMLATKDAHTLYEKYGFKSLSTPERFMEIKPFETYSK